MRALLDIPDGFAVAALVAMGYPEPDKIPKRLRRRAVEEFAFADAFGVPFGVEVEDRPSAAAWAER